MTLKVLYANPEFPDRSMSDRDLGQVSEEQRAQGLALQRAVESLEAVGHDVTIARTFGDALNLIDATAIYFDVAVIELSWDADRTLEPDARGFAGWTICRKIDEVNKNRPSKPTLKVICSDRLAEDAGISVTAASRGILPIYNQYNNVTAQMLRAAISFIESGLTRASPEEELALTIERETRESLNDYLNQPLADYRQWFKMTLGFVFLSVVLLLVGIGGAIFGYVQLGILTSASSLISGMVSGLLFNQLRQREHSVKESLEKAEALRKEAVERVFSEKTTSLP